MKEDLVWPRPRGPATRPEAWHVGPGLDAPRGLVFGPSQASASGSCTSLSPWGLPWWRAPRGPLLRPPSPQARARPEAPAPPAPVCLEDAFGPDCSLTCEDCGNGGTCLPGLDGCDCPAGWTGLVCNESEALLGGGAGWGGARELGTRLEPIPWAPACWPRAGGPCRPAHPLAVSADRLPCAGRLALPDIATDGGREMGVPAEEELVAGPVPPSPGHTA